MAVTWLDTPGLAISQRETIDFIVPALPVVITVGYYTAVRSRETAFQDGAFLYPYLGSTVEGSGPYTVHLRRSGGWPDDAQVYVNESGGGAVVAPSWHKIYELDFTSLVSSTFFFPTNKGAFTIAGKTWYLKSTFNIANMTPFLDPFLGLGWNISFGEGSPIGNLDGVPSIVDTPHWWLPFSAIPEYDPSIPICVRFRPPDFTASTSDQGGFAVGLTSHTNDVVVHSVADRKYDAFVIRPGGTGRVSTASAFGNSGISAFQTGMNGKNGLAVYSYPGLGGAHLVAGTDAVTWTGFPADPSLMLQVSTGNIGYSGNKVVLPRPNPGIMFMSYGNGIPGSAVAIRNFEIWQYYS